MDEITDEDVLDDLRGRRILHAERGDGGIHIELDNHKTLVMVGVEIIAMVHRATIQ